MNLLPLQLKKKGIIYTQIDRTPTHGFYSSAYDTRPNRVLGYEIFKIRKRKAHLRNGKEILAHEIYPNDEDFGFTATSICGEGSVERAVAAWLGIKPEAQIDLPALNSNFIQNLPILI